MESYITRKQRTIASLVKGEKILDIGFAEYPNSFLENPIGIDIQDIEKPTNYQYGLTINLNKQEIPFEDNRFDTIIAGEVMEHLENPSFALREINRTLKDNGTLIVSIPNATYYWNIIRDYFFSNIPNMDNGEHLNCWTIIDFKRLLQKNGFKVKKLYGTSFVSPPPFWFKIPMRLFPKLSWIIIYECEKVNKPIEDVITRKRIGENKISEECILIKNERK